MSTVLQVRIDEDTKEGAEFVLKSIGLDLSTAVRMFLLKVKNTGGLPFEPVMDTKLTPEEFDETIKNIQQRAKEDELDKLTLDEINQIIAETRSEIRKKEKKYLVIIDKKVLVSYLIHYNAHTNSLFSNIKNKRLIPVYNESILEEYLSELKTKTYGFKKMQILDAISLIKENGSEITSIKKLNINNLINDKIFTIVSDETLTGSSSFTEIKDSTLSSQTVIINAEMMNQIVHYNK